MQSGRPQTTLHPAPPSIEEPARIIVTLSLAEGQTIELETHAELKNALLGPFAAVQPLPAVALAAQRVGGQLTTTFSD